MFQFLRKKSISFVNDKKGISAVVGVGAVLFGSVVLFTAANLTASLSNKSSTQKAGDMAVTGAVALQNDKNDQKSRKAYCQQAFENSVKSYATIEKLECTVKDNKEISVSLDATIKVKKLINFGTEEEGYETINIKSTAVMNPFPHEVVIAVSTSGSMCAINEAQSNGDQNYLKVTTDPACKKLDAAKNGVRGLLDELVGSPDMKVGLVPYTYKVRFPYPLDSNGNFNKFMPLNKEHIPPSLYDSEGDKTFYTDFNNEPDLRPLIPLKRLTANSLKNFQGYGKNNEDLEKTNPTLVDSSYPYRLNATTSTPAWARTDLAMQVAGLMLDPESSKYFTYHYAGYPTLKADATPASFPTKEDPDEKLAKKVVVLISDGANLGGAYTNNPAGNFENQYLYEYAPYTQHTLAVCEALKKKQIQIFTVLLNVPKNTAGAETIADLMSRCSSGGDSSPEANGSSKNYEECNDKNPYCFNVVNPEELQRSLVVIGKRIKETRLAR